MIHTTNISGTTADYTDIQVERLFESHRHRPSVKEFFNQLRGKNDPLGTLTDILESHEVEHQSVAGRQAVSLNQIKGSSVPGRTQDFSADFRPKQTHTKSRWVSIASARARGKRMPSVRLTAVRMDDAADDIYFVEDGHHRISVAHAFGDDMIDAEVTVIHLSGGQA